jgi:2-dehydro-3-deoxyphosphogluconate aldolase/(4S)-4-hydroxy-2-oxoglutarate aldolase
VFSTYAHFDKADPGIMGVGSITDAPTAGIYIANGAFVVGPILSADVPGLQSARLRSPGRLGQRNLV